MLLIRKSAAILFLFISFLLQAQKTTVYIDPNLEYKNGLELFDKKLYNAAQKCFQNVISTTTNPKSLVRIDAEFYAAACALELFHKDGEWRFRKFIAEHPESNRVKWAYFYLGKSNFRKKKYEEVIKWLEQVEVYDLNKEDLAELYFKRGYSYFESDNYAKAKLDLYEIKDADNKYTHPANYYYSHIAYSEKNYETAAEGFRRLVNNETFGSVVPFYIAQIYYLQRKYDSVIKIGPSLLNDSAKVLKRAEISKIIGEAYYQKKEYEKALPYLKEYGGVTQDDNYQLGFALYKTGNKKEAQPYFENAVTGNDTIAQSAWYHLADCQLNAGEKTKARNSFYQAWKTGENEVIKEDALYSFAKLSYELSLTPYNEAINAFSEYISKYPNSPRKDEAYRYLVNVFASTQNYLEAMKAIDKIKNADLNLRTIYQRMAWYYGITWFNNNRNDSAQHYFNIALSNGYDPRISALATFWTGEIYYRNKNYNAAIETFNEFQGRAAAPALDEYDVAKYNIAYSYFMLKDYEKATNYFSQFMQNKNGPEKMSDAAARLGDCFFIKGNFSSAAESYQKAIDFGKTDVEYCLYQKAICSGRLTKYSEKIQALKTLIEKYPNSNHISSSYLEIAEAYVRDKQYDNAITWYNNFLKKFTTSDKEFLVKAQIGVLYVNKNEKEKALQYFTEVATKNPNSSISQQTAIPNIKSILLSQGKTQEWEDFANKYGLTVDRDEIEESTYNNAKKFYVDEQNCDKAMPECENYIRKFPEGPHAQEVNFWLAECAFSKNMFDKALASYLYLLKQEKNNYKEKALSKAAFIYYKNKQYAEALPLYIQLGTSADDPLNKFNAKIYAMRCAWNTQNFETAAEQATQVISNSKSKPEQVAEARKIRAHSNYSLGKFGEAMDDFKLITKTAESIDGAEAYYYISVIHLKNKNYKEVEKTIDKLMSYKYADKSWMTKGLLVMSDCYIEQKKYSDAEALLQTIIDNQVDPALKEQAQKKLDEVKQLQNARLAPATPETGNGQKVEFQNNGDQKDLFDELYEQMQQKKDTLNPAEPK